MKTFKSILSSVWRLILLPIIYPLFVIYLFYEYKLSEIRAMTIKRLCREIDEVYEFFEIVFLLTFHLLTLCIFIKNENN